MADPFTALQVDEGEITDADSSLGDDEISSTASMTRSMLRYRQENGRTYHAYRDGLYHFPNDERENERLDLGLAPPNEKDTKSRRVLDLGTGTGIWALDYGEEHPGSEVIGVDLSPNQPDFVASNVMFQIDDFEDEWTYSQPFDYIHSRMNNSSVSDWKTYIRKSFDHLTPGGYLELQEFSLPLSDDGTLTPAHALQKSMNLLQEAAAATNHAFVDIHNLKAMLTDAGFVDVVEVKYKWPSNTWPQDPKFKEIGEWNNYNIKAGMEGFLMAALTRALGWRQEEVSALAAQAKIDLDDRGVHAYWPMVVVYGRKPESTG